MYKLLPSSLPYRIVLYNATSFLASQQPPRYPDEKGSLTKLQMAFVYRSNANNLGIEETKLLREPDKHLDSAASVPVRYCG